MATLNITALTPLDCVNAAQLHQQSFFKGWERTVFHEFLRTPLTFGLKIEDDDILVAYLMWREILGEAEILTLVVAPSYRQKGYGSALLKALFATLKDKGIPKLFIEVAEDNEAAISFYTNHGFIFMGKRPHYYLREGNTSISALNFFKDIV